MFRTPISRSFRLLTGKLASSVSHSPLCCYRADDTIMMMKAFAGYSNGHWRSYHQGQFFNRPTSQMPCCSQNHAHIPYATHLNCMDSFAFLQSHGKLQHTVYVSHFSTYPDPRQQTDEKASTSEGEKPANVANQDEHNGMTTNVTNEDEHTIMKTNVANQDEHITTNLANQDDHMITNVANQDEHILTEESIKHGEDRTTEKASKGENMTAKEANQDMTLTAKAANQDENLTVSQRFKRAYKEHGKILLGVHLTNSAMWYGSFYIAVRCGIDFVPYLENWGLSETVIKPFRPGGAGDFAIAYLLYKLASPVRYTITLGGTNLVIRHKRRTGKMAPKPKEDSLRQLYKDSRKKLKL